MKLQEICSLILAVSVLSGTLVLLPSYEVQSAPKPIVVIERKTLLFANIAGSSDGIGTVTVDVNNNISTTGYAIYMGGRVRAGKFKITGDAGAVVTITLPVTAQITNGSSTVILSNFTSKPSGTTTLNSKGKKTVWVGATMSVPTNLLSGSYTGTFTIYAD